MGFVIPLTFFYGGSFQKHDFFSTLSNDFVEVESFNSISSSGKQEINRYKEKIFLVILI